MKAQPLPLPQLEMILRMINKVAVAVVIKLHSDFFLQQREKCKQTIILYFFLTKEKIIISSNVL